MKLKSVGPIQSPMVANELILSLFNTTTLQTDSSMNLFYTPGDEMLAP